jgi:hypothetical protein
MNLKNPYRGAKGMKAQMVPQTLDRAIDSCRNKKTGLVTAGKPYRRGRLDTVDLLVLTSLDQVIFILKILFTCSTKQPTLIRRSTGLSFPLQLVFPGYNNTKVKDICRHWYIGIMLGAYSKIFLTYVLTKLLKTIRYKFCQIFLNFF